jgi:DNA-directed RNA polymerase specialized sigma24 family protein
LLQTLAASVLVSHRFWSMVDTQPADAIGREARSNRQGLRGALAERRGRPTEAGVDEASLLAEISAGSMLGVEEAVDRHADRLYALGVLVGERPERADDAVTDAFVRLWRDPDGVVAGGEGLQVALAGEVYARRTRATSREDHRRSGSERAVGGGGKSSAAAVSAALADLARVDRELLALIVFGGHSRRQAAVRAEVSENTAARSLTEALRAVADRLRAGDGLEGAESLRRGLSGRVDSRAFPRAGEKRPC